MRPLFYAQNQGIDFLKLQYLIHHRSHEFHPTQTALHFTDPVSQSEFKYTSLCDTDHHHAITMVEHRRVETSFDYQ